MKTGRISEYLLAIGTIPMLPVFALAFTCGVVCFGARLAFDFGRIWVEAVTENHEKRKTTASSVD